MTLFDSEQLPDLRGRLVCELSKDDRVLFAFLHGSAQQGLSFRDLDVAFCIKESEQPGYVVLGEIQEHLERQLGLPCDVHSLSGSPPLFSYQVSQGELLICNDELALATWRERTWNEYFRFQPHAERLVQDWLAS